jgi:hypothetical protein
MAKPVQKPANEKSVLRCIKCGAECAAPCNCGQPYAFIRPREAAAKALAMDCERSDRAVAKAIGVGRMTVARARETVPNGTVARRTGSDGVIRSLPTLPAARRRHVTIEDVDRDQYKHVADTAKALHQQLCDLEIAAHRKLSREAMAVVDALDGFLRWLKR